MTESKVRLITFGSSHYCEKARWALDWHDIPCREVGWPPGLHQVLAKRCGAKASLLPILLDGEAVIQGSVAIIDWAESKTNDPIRSLAPRGNSTEAQEIEARANEVIGIHVRRLAYAEMLPTCMFTDKILMRSS
jgi:glutathione S-transferase